MKVTMGKILRYLAHLVCACVIVILVAGAMLGPWSGRTASPDTYAPTVQEWLIVSLNARHRVPYDRDLGCQTEFEEGEGRTVRICIHYSDSAEQVSVAAAAKRALKQASECISEDPRFEGTKITVEFTQRDTNKITVFENPGLDSQFEIE